MEKQLFIFLAVLLTLTAQAQQQPTDSVLPSALSLNDYRQHVLDYSQELKQAKEDISGSDYQRKAAITGYLPQIDLSADVSYDLIASQFAGQTLEPFNYSVGANLTQNIFAGGTVITQHKMAKTQVQIAELSEQLTIEEVLYRAEVTYWLAAATKQYLSNAEAYYRVVKALFDVVDKRFDDGYVSKSDLLMVNTRLKEAELQWNSAKRAASVAFQNLNILMGTPVDKAIDVTDLIDTELDLPTYKTLDDVLSIRPEYLLVDKNITKQKQYVSSVYAQYNPMIVGGIKAGWGTPMINLTGESSFNSTVYASFRFPLLEWGKRSYSARAAKVEVNKLNMEKVRVTDQINSELSSSWVNLNDNYKQIIIANENLSIAAENMDLNTLRYNEGQLPILDVLSSQLSWIQAFNNSVQAEYNYKVAYADYKKATGVMQ
ncbi:MAG: TolC family protein [Paludibacteraceae bacterium]|nr:TolC family protein [Paludibacteraceae bacterium]